MAAVLDTGEARSKRAVPAVSTGERILRLQPIRAWFNDRYRNVRGYTARGGTWHRVGVVSVILGLGVLAAVPVVGGGGSGSSRLVASSHFNDWAGYSGPTTTQAPPTTVAAPAPVVKHAAPPRASRSAPGPCDRPSNCPQLRQCENGGSYGTHSANGYTGAYQISGSTGRSVGMPANPTPAQQDAAADAIYARGGKSQWPVCGRFLR